MVGFLKGFELRTVEKQLFRVKGTGQPRGEGNRKSVSVA